MLSSGATALVKKEYVVALQRKLRTERIAFFGLSFFILKLILGRILKTI